MTENILQQLQNEKAVISGSIINDSLNLNRTTTKSKSIVFVGVQFFGSLIINEIDLEAIEFKNCFFAKSIIFQNVKLNGNIKNPDTLPVRLIINDCKTLSNLIDIQIKNCRFEGAFCITQTNGLQVQIAKSVIKRFQLDNSHFVGFLDFNDNELIGDLVFDNVTFNKEFANSHTVYDSLYALKCTFQEKVVFTRCKFKNALRFEECTHNADVKIENIESLSDNSALYLTKGNYSGNFEIYYWDLEDDNGSFGGFKRIIMMENTFLNTLNIIKKQNHFDEALYNANLNLLNLSNNNFVGSLQVEGFKNINLWVQGENLKGNLFFKNLKLSNLNIDKLSNYGNLQFIHCEAYRLYKYPSLTICNSYFEKTNFTNCDLSSFEFYTIKNSNFSNIKSTNTKWFHYNSLKHKKLKHKKLTEAGITIHRTPEQFAHEENFIENRAFQEMREIFRQLKYAMESQGDRITALRFKRDEMKAYYSSVKEEKNVSVGDKFILMSGWTNDHGQNWLRPLGLLFLSSIIFYISMLFILGYPLGIFRNSDIYFQLLNPTHSLDKLFPDNKGWKLDTNQNIIINILDFFHKVILSFLIFQIISAFRKFIK